MRQVDPKTKTAFTNQWAYFVYSSRFVLFIASLDAVLFTN